MCIYIMTPIICTIPLLHIIGVIINYFCGYVTCYWIVVVIVIMHYTIVMV